MATKKSSKKTSSTTAKKSSGKSPKKSSSFASKKATAAKKSASGASPKKTTDRSTKQSSKKGQDNSTEKSRADAGSPASSGSGNLEIRIPSRDSILLYSWNVNGIRANIKKGFFDWIKKEAPDVVCLQETRATLEQLQQDAKSRPVLHLEPYSSHWHVADKKGYSGVATFSAIPVRNAQSGFAQDDPSRNFNEEGRVVVTELDDFVLWNVYFPNGGRGPERVKYKMEFYDHCLKIWEKTRKEGKKLIICGDYNTAHKEIDLARPKENQTTSGFLPEEREFLDRIVGMGYVDVFRQFNQEPGQYTYWDQITRARERNVGWRIDYFFVTEETMPMVKNAFIRMDVMGSDHCPIGLELKKS